MTPVRERIAKLSALWSGSTQRITSRFIRERFHVSRATSKRDLALLKRTLGQQFAERQGGAA